MNKVSMLSKSAEHHITITAGRAGVLWCWVLMRSERTAEDKLLELPGQVSGLCYHKVHTFDTHSWPCLVPFSKYIQVGNESSFQLYAEDIRSFPNPYSIYKK